MRPDYSSDRGLGPLPVDVTVNGQPLAGQVDPPVWVVPGQGWGWYNAKIGARWVNEGTVLWIYARTPREVSLELRLLSEAALARLQVASGEQRDPAQRRQGLDDAASVSLNAGWNRIVLDLHPGIQLGTGLSPDGWFMTQFDICTS